MSFFSVLIVVVILSITLTTSYLATQPVSQANNSQLTLTRLDTLRTAILNYRYHNNNANPATLDVLVTPGAPACTVNTNTSSPSYKQLQGWCGPYLLRAVQEDPNEFKRDGWGILIQLSPTTLISCGKNLICGDADDIALGI